MINLFNSTSVICKDFSIVVQSKSVQKYVFLNVYINCF